MHRKSWGHVAGGKSQKTIPKRTLRNFIKKSAKGEEREGGVLIWDTSLSKTPA